MTIISADQEYSAFILGSGVKFKNTSGLKLMQPTPLNDLAVNMKWKGGDLIGVLRFSVYYYNSDGKAVIVNYTTYDYKLNEITLINLVNSRIYEEFMCTHLMFEYLGATKDPSTPFAITVSKFDTVKEQVDYQYQAINHQELGFPNFADVVNVPAVTPL